MMDLGEIIETTEEPRRQEPIEVENWPQPEEAPVEPEREEADAGA